MVSSEEQSRNKVNLIIKSQRSLSQTLIILMRIIRIQLRLSKAVTSCTDNYLMGIKLAKPQYYALNKILNSDWLNTNLTLVNVWLAGGNVRQRNHMSGH